MSQQQSSNELVQVLAHQISDLDILVQNGFGTHAVPAPLDINRLPANIKLVDYGKGVWKTRDGSTFNIGECCHDRSWRAPGKTAIGIFDRTINEHTRRMKRVAQSV